MRLVVGAALIGGMAALSACVPIYYGPTPPGSEIVRIDPEDAAERALTGAVLGTALGTGLGASLAINPAIGAVVGAESGAALGAAVGIATAQPIPNYRPIALPAAASAPEFYDTWPPGYHPPPLAAAAPPPPG